MSENAARRAPGRARRRDRGIALLVTMLILIAMAIMGVVTLDAVMSDQQVAGFQSRGHVAFHAAEAGVAVTHSNLNGATTPTIAQTNLGDAATYPLGQPLFQADPNVAEPVKDQGGVAAQGMNLRIGGGGPRYQMQYWRFHIQGTAPGGTNARVETTMGVLKGS